MSYKLSTQSLQNLVGVHKDLVNVVVRAITLTSVDFKVLEGLRSLDQQKKNLANGSSQTLNSRHLSGHAVDLGAIVNGLLTWDWPPYESIAKAMKQAAYDIKVPIQWGGDWQYFKDGTHFQLPWARYPIQDLSQNVTFRTVPSEVDGS